jgi:hypothetical protein
MALHLSAALPGASAIVNAVNGLTLAKGISTSVHLDAGEFSVTAANAVDLPTSLTLTCNLIGVLLQHGADSVAHQIAGSVSTLPTVASVLDLPSAISAYGSIKTWWTSHIASASLHYTVDATNAWTSTAPTDLPSLITALNEAKTKVNAHIANAPAFGMRLRVVG